MAQSNKNANMSKYDYMKKKQNKGKQFSRDKKTFSLDEEGFVSQELPDGAFVKGSKIQEEFISKNTDLKDKPIAEEKEAVQQDLVTEEVDDDGYEKFDPSYFDSVEYK